MKLLSSFLFLSSLVLWASCGSAGNSNGSQQEESRAGTDPEAAVVNDSVPMSTDSYTIRILDSEQASPRKEMTGSIGETEITVNYGSPYVKGRVIWGGLEPYGKVWRSGANEATTMSFSTDVQIEGQPLAAGTYTFFTIPEEGDWTVIFNSVLEQWGAYSHDPSKDVLRTTVSPVMKEANQESLEYYLDGQDIVLRWEKVALPVTVSPAP